MNMRVVFFAIVLMLAFAACGGGHKNASSTASAPSSPTAAGRVNAPGAAAPLPAGLHCGAVSPVWVNTRTHVYHVASDPMYGRTTHGEYMCPSAAAEKGYHPAGGMRSTPKHHRKGGAMMQAQPSPSPSY